MSMVGSFHVKICCISSVEEARLAISLGASALGFVSSMPSGPGVIDEALIAEIVRHVPDPMGTFLLTSKQDAVSIETQHKVCKTSVIQLVDAVARTELRRLRLLLPTVSLVQVIHVNSEASVTEALDVAPYVDALLLDSGNPNLKIKELGGTGRIHDWSLSRKIRDACALPVYLAGGLNAGNVAEAIAMVRPFGLDLCSGVRTNGQLSATRLQEFMQVVERVDS
jgi:phosphoribosylanthranilate isomerase